MFSFEHVFWLMTHNFYFSAFSVWLCSKLLNTGQTLLLFFNTIRSGNKHWTRAPWRLQGRESMRCFRSWQNGNRNKSFQCPPANKTTQPAQPVAKKKTHWQHFSQPQKPRTKMSLNMTSHHIWLCVVPTPHTSSPVISPVSPWHLRHSFFRSRRRFFDLWTFQRWDSCTPPRFKLFKFRFFKHFSCFLSLSVSLRFLGFLGFLVLRAAESATLEPSTVPPMPLTMHEPLSTKPDLEKWMRRTFVICDLRFSSLQKGNFENCRTLRFSSLL